MSLQAPNLFGLLKQVFAAHPEVDTKQDVDSVRGVMVDWFCHEANKLDTRQPWGRKARQKDGGNKNGDGAVFLRTDGLMEIYDVIDGGSGGASWGAPAGPIANGSNGYWSPANPVTEQPQAPPQTTPATPPAGPTSPAVDPVAVELLKQILVASQANLSELQGIRRDLTNLGNALKQYAPALLGTSGGGGGLGGLLGGLLKK